MVTANPSSARGERDGIPEPEEADAIRAFRDDLLRRTIAWCAERSPFYRERFGAAADGFRGMEDLPRLPVLTREEASLHQRELLCHEIAPSHVQYTTGTTGTPLYLYRSGEEVSFISDFFRQLDRDAAPRKGPRPLFLVLVGTYHGQATPLPSWPYVVTAGVYDRTQASQARMLLQTRFELPGVEPTITGISAEDILIKAFTAYLIAEGIDPAELTVRRLSIGGGYMSAARKRLLGDIWRSSVHDRYSMSEIFGGATECGVGGPWFFDTHVVPEVVHPRTFQPVEEGVGLLVLTGLYPFMQMMPLVRYVTGDLVEVADHPARGAADVIVRFVGRARRSLVDSSGADVVPLVLSNPLQDMMESFPDVMASVRFADIGSGPGLELAGKLHYEVAYEPGAVRLRLGLRYPPWHYPERVTEVKSKLRRALFDRFPALAERVARGDLELSVETAHGSQVTPFNAK